MFCALSICLTLRLTTAQAAAVAETKQRADLEVVGDGEQPPRLVRAHHQRDLLGLADVIDLGRKIQSLQLHTRQNPTDRAPAFLTRVSGRCRCGTGVAPRNTNSCRRLLNCR